MEKQLEQVAEFHKAFNIPILKADEVPAQERIDLRLKLIKEEFDELKEADGIGNMEHIAKEACDLVYVTLGTVLEFGLHKLTKHPMIYMLSIGFNRMALGAPMVDFADFEKALSWVVECQSPQNIELFLILLVDYISAKGFDKETIERCFSEVHRSNMSKLDANGQPVYRADGKVIKSGFYQPADLSFLRVAA